jgi:repressor LexA
MLTRKQHELLMFIHERIKETGVSPSFDEMKEALDLASKSGIHRLITALEERGFIRRLAHRARALEVMKLPEQATTGAPRGRAGFTPAVIEGGGRSAAAEPANDTRELVLVGKIAAGAPIAALQGDNGRYSVPEAMLGAGEHYMLEIEGDSMIEAGILDGDLLAVQKAKDAKNGQIVVARLGDDVTVKRLRRTSKGIELIPENPDFETIHVPPEADFELEGIAVGLIRNTVLM